MDEMQPIADSPDDPEQGTSTSASGPAGTHFEGQVAAFYMLAMLCGAPPRGLPGTSIVRVALQQANTGRPLDDVVVHAVDGSGRPAVLEIQVKRTIKFTPADPVFKKVVGQIAQAVSRSDFWSTNYCLAIATSRGSRKIDGPYQDLLALARQIGNAATFSSQLRLSGVANDDMRTFVKTLQAHLKDEKAPHDEETIWKLLRRLQILTFDFTATGSASEDLARERALRTLHFDDAPRVDAFWASLIELAISVAKNGGDRSRSALLESLQPLGFRFAGERRHAGARAVLAEHARQALADIDNRVGQVVLARRERIAAVHEALDLGRYVEIRGDAGVGKSGVLRQLAESFQKEGNVLVLSPGRCVPRGGSAMRAQIGFEGTLRDLLVDLANDGGATLFLDNLDSFSDEERLTVVDVLRDAAQVHGVSVLATVRTDFGVEESSWLPAEALDGLKRAPVVTIDALSATEIEQLATGNPALVPLLSENHPARQVTRNLFRLARIALQPAAEPFPRTEAEMATQWWSSADGKLDAGWRDRARLLGDLARQVLSGPDLLDVSTQPAESIDALVRSGTLRSLGANRVSFRHDVLREWAIACALREDANLIDRLGLKRPALGTHARGTELLARMMLETSAGGAQWSGFVARLSGDGVHKSWRRAALFAPARSEAAEVILPRIQSILFSDRAALLRELLRTVMAVEVVSVSEAFAIPGVNLDLIPAGLTIPRGPAWPNLIFWLLRVGNGIPSEAIPEVVDLYTSFSVGTLGISKVTQLTTQQMYQWLRQMEPTSSRLESDDGVVFWRGLEREQVRSLVQDLRSGFLMFARSTPSQAAEYLRAVEQAPHNDELVRSILRMRGTLAQAAPAELARLTELSLIDRARLRDQGIRRERRRPFTFMDSEFLPASPAQGPFFELLVHSSHEGLELIHRLISHAITSGVGDRDAGEDSIGLAYPEGTRVFPWKGTYFWSRQSNYYAITSALMALEAWAHRRVESGDPFASVLKDVLGPPGSCAAYLLVAVDLIISHWPESRASALEFLGCPELLCLDHNRLVYDQVELPDIFGFRALQVEPRGTVSIAELKQQASRYVTLDGLIGNYALTAKEDELRTLTSYLAGAAARLGPASAEANLGDPELMVLHALNLADPANWPEVETALKDGSKKKARRYVPPPSEEAHFRRLRDAAAENSTELGFQSSIALAIDDRSRLSLDQLKAAVEWARRPATLSPTDDDDSTSQSMRREAVLAAAMMVMRAGDASMIEAHGEWACAQLLDTIASDERDPVLQIRAGLRFNPISIAYAGMIHALTRRSTPDDVRALLEVAAGDHHAAAHGFGAALRALEAVDARLPCAVLRCALRACVVPVQKWDRTDEEGTSNSVAKDAAARAAVDSEIAWLQESGPEPTWPAFPKDDIRPKRRPRLRLPTLQPSEDAPEVEVRPPANVVHYQSAALWLRQVRSLGNVDKVAWLQDVLSAYMPWTIDANGGGLADGEEVDDPPSEWNGEFFALAARCTVNLSATQVSDLITTPIAGLPDQNFLDVLVDFLRSLDEVYFQGDNVDAAVAVETRSALADRLMSCRGWERMAGTKDLSIEWHIAPAIATLFFNDYHFGGRTQSYLYENGAERIEPFLPVLSRLVVSGPSPFVALVLLNLLAVEPRSAHLGLLLQAARTWLATYPDFKLFWIDHGIGKRWCEIVQRIHMRDSGVIGFDTTIRPDIEAMVADLVALGVAEASQLEGLMTGAKGS